MQQGLELIGESMGIGEQPAELAQFEALLAPWPTEDMICWPLSAHVGNVKNNDPSLIEPVCRQSCLAERWPPNQEPAKRAWRSRHSPRDKARAER